MNRLEIVRSGGGSNMGSVPLSLKFLAPFREEEGNPRWTARTGIAIATKRA